jgi:hypothetical protein
MKINPPLEVNDSSDLLWAEKILRGKMVPKNAKFIHYRFQNTQTNRINKIMVC